MDGVPTAHVGRTVEVSSVEMESADGDMSVDELEAMEGAETILGLLHFGNFARSHEDPRLKSFPKLPVPVEALKGETGQEIGLCTTDRGVKRLLQRMRSGWKRVAQSEGSEAASTSVGSSVRSLDTLEAGDTTMDGDRTLAVADLQGSSSTGSHSVDAADAGDSRMGGDQKPAVTDSPASSSTGFSCPIKAWLTSRAKAAGQGSQKAGLCRRSGSQAQPAEKFRVDTHPATTSGHYRPACLLKRILRSPLKFNMARGRPCKQKGKSDGHEPPKAMPCKEGAHQWGNVHHMLGARELGMCRGGGFSRSQQCHILCGRRIPAFPTRVIQELPSRGYIGQFSKDGNLFVAAFQDKRIHVYDVQHGWRLRKNISARMLRWTITDTAVSPDGRMLLYSSITPIVHLVNIGSHLDGVDSISNVTEVHDALAFGESYDGSRLFPGNMIGIWSLAWSPNGQEIVAGTSNCNICVYDLEAQKPTMTVQAHRDDVNAVTFLDDSANVFASGSDDALVKIWDRRTLGPRLRAAGVLVGHTEGVTHLDGKGDGHSLISNCKDQTVKLWDLRKSVTEGALAKRCTPRLPHFHWDYRWSRYPGEGRNIVHPDDASLMTYRGHSVLKTLIRAYFSPSFTTGQRYIYTGSCTGTMHVFDVVTGEQVETLQHHVVPVRDCSWHPTEPMLASVGWDGCVVKWEPRESCSDGKNVELLRQPSGDKFDY
eukprot:evm.model.scf_1154EXC.2 EVM.evm.TU.scf_1154EXC.2   scf_1154EXC:21146-23272(+)